MHCPACNVTLQTDEIRFSESFTCNRCGVGLSISATYLRVLALLGIPCAVGLLWLMRIRGLLLYVLWLPMEILLYVLMVKVTLKFARPALVQRGFEHVTKLNLGPPT